jgi:hypothetical protein
MGLDSAWNWGAGLGLFHHEFLARVLEYEAPSDDIRLWMKTLVTSNNTELRGVDKACGAILSETGIDEFVLVDNGETTYLWPRIKHGTIISAQPTRVHLDSVMIPAYVARMGL